MICIYLKHIVNYKLFNLYGKKCPKSIPFRVTYLEIKSGIRQLNPQVQIK